MATGKVTIGSLAKLEGWLWDTNCVGFGARRQRDGVFYYLRYRHNGTQRMQSIGRHGSPWTPDTARKRARELLGTVAGGTDPFAQPLASEGCAALIERYLECKHRALKPTSYSDLARCLRKHAAPLHGIKLGEIDRRTIAVLLGEIETGSGPIACNRCRAWLNGFFSWCITEGLLENNPVQGTAKADEGNSRERVLTQDELRKLWHNLGQGSFSDIVRLLLLTGQRRNEIGRLAWSEIDLARKLLVLPPARTKNSRQHDVPLSAQALAILARYPHRWAFVFSERSYMNWSDAKARLDRRVGIEEWRLHDLRRTCATGMAELGVQPHIIEAVLNHVSGHKADVAGIYNRARYEGEMCAALQRWADHVDKITHIDD